MENKRNFENFEIFSSQHLKNEMDSQNLENFNNNDKNNDFDYEILKKYAKKLQKKVIIHKNFSQS